MPMCMSMYIDMVHMFAACKSQTKPQMGHA